MKTILRIGFVFLLSSTLISCKKEGCTDPTALNYDSNADVDNGSCQLPSSPPPAQIMATIDGVPFSSSSNYDTLYYDSFTALTVFEFTGGDMVFGPNVRVQLFWTLPLQHPQLTNELLSVAFSDGNGVYQNGTPSVQITSLDTTNRLVSGTFASINASEGNPPTYHNLTNGVFTNIPY